MLKKSFPCLMQIRSQAQFQDLCQQHVRGEAEGASRGGCCPSWSLGNYLAVLTNASCCLSLTSHQVVQLSLILAKRNKTRATHCNNKLKVLYKRPMCCTVGELSMNMWFKKKKLVEQMKVVILVVVVIHQQIMLLLLRLARGT